MQHEPSWWSVFFLKLLLLPCLLLGGTAASGPTEGPARLSTEAIATAFDELEDKAVQQSALNLARATMVEFLATRKTPAVPDLASLPPALRRRAGVFVTVEKRGQITPRGCRGTLEPASDSLASEIVRNAVAACIRDRSEPPLRAAEIKQCLISLTVVRRTEPLQSIAQHDAENNGLIAESAGRIGIVLPYEGRDATTQLLWAKRKAGVADDAAVQLRELFAVRFRETPAK